MLNKVQKTIIFFAFGVLDTSQGLRGSFNNYPVKIGWLLNGHIQGSYQQEDLHKNSS